MQVTRRFAVLSTALGIAVTTALAVNPAPAGAASQSGVVSVPVHGRLLVVPSETPDGHPSYGVALADGDIVPVRGSFDPSVRTGAVFDGRLALPTSITGALARRSAVADPQRAALRLVDRRSLTLAVVGTPSVTAVAPAVAPTTHRQFVAVVDNKGVVDQTDAQLLAHVTNVGTYWKGQANGAITGITVPATVKHFSDTTGSTACGLGASTADFFSLVQEAKALFPTFDFSQNSPDQLVLFVPESCFTGPTVGRGTIGSSFASGGSLIAEASPSIEGVYAHETGHNYGFQHANARLSSTSMEYLGIYDVMGGALPPPFTMLTALSTPYRVFQGITDPGEIQDVALGALNQPVHATATIKPRSDATGLRSVSVVDPDTGERLYLDDRSGTGTDTGSFYAAGRGLLFDDPVAGNGTLGYAPGVVITAVRGSNGVDDLVLPAIPPDTTRPTSLKSGQTWTNGSGDLSIQVTSLDANGAVVSVDYTPATQSFTTSAIPVIGGDVRVAGAVTLDPGTWSPTATTTTIRWTAGGVPVPNTDDQTSFVPSPLLVGKQLVATVTAAKAGFLTTSVSSAPVTVTPGTIPLFTAPSITGSPEVGSVLLGHPATWGTMLSTVSEGWHWRADGVDIPGATALDYTVKPGDVGKTITLVEVLTAPAYQPVTTESLPTAAVPAPVISPAPAPTVGGSPRVGSVLTVQPGVWMSGVSLGFQWYVAGQPVAGATGTSYTPRAGDLAQTVRVEVTGSRADYPPVTQASTETAAVAVGVLTTAKPTISGTPAVGRTLTARPGAWTTRTAFGYAWFAEGVRIKGQTAKRLVLAKAQRGKQITVKVTGAEAGYASASRTSAKTPQVR
jgi:hypothetical protein